MSFNLLGCKPVEKRSQLLVPISTRHSTNTDSDLVSSHLTKSPTFLLDWSPSLSSIRNFLYHLYLHFLPQLPPLDLPLESSDRLYLFPLSQKYSRNATCRHLERLLPRPTTLLPVPSFLHSFLYHLHHLLDQFLRVLPIHPLLHRDQTSRTVRIANRVQHILNHLSDTSLHYNIKHASSQRTTGQAMAITAIVPRFCK